MPADDLLPNPVDVIAWQERIKRAALGLLRRRPTGPYTLEEARLLRDASMLCTLLMHSSMAQRTQVAIEVKASRFASEACARPGCLASQAGKCRGTRFERISNSKWRLIIPHWKSSGSRPGPILEITDQGEVTLLDGYERLGRPALERGAQPRKTAMYLTTRGCEFNQPTMSNWWRDTYK